MSEIQEQKKPAKRLRKWLIVIAGVVFIGYGLANLDLSSSPDLEVRTQKYPARSGLIITNTGSDAVQIVDITLNDRPECTMSLSQNAPATSDEQRHKAWVANGLFAKLDIHSQAPRTLKIGESVQWLASCDDDDIVRAEIRTDKGAGTYTFKQ